jgi:hypothetical protein
MTTKLASFVLFLCLGTFSMHGQGIAPGEDFYPIEKNMGSKFMLDDGVFRIEANKILPISFVLLNHDKPKQLSLHITVMEHPGFPTPIQNGFQVLGKNPTLKQKAEPFESKLFRINIRINSEKYQFLQVKILDESDTILDSFHIVVNDPKYSDSTIWKYRPFDESKLFNFTIPPGWHL